MNQCNRSSYPTILREEGRVLTNTNPLAPSVSKSSRNADEAGKSGRAEQMLTVLDCMGNVREGRMAGPC